MYRRGKIIVGTFRFGGRVRWEEKQWKQITFPGSCHAQSRKTAVKFSSRQCDNLATQNKWFFVMGPRQRRRWKREFVRLLNISYLMTTNVHLKFYRVIWLSHECHRENWKFPWELFATFTNWNDDVKSKGGINYQSTIISLNWSRAKLYLNSFLCLIKPSHELARVDNVLYCILKQRQ